MIKHSINKNYKKFPERKNKKMKKIIVSILILVISISQSVFALEVYPPLEVVEGFRNIKIPDVGYITPRLYNTGMEYLKIDYMSNGVDIYRSKDCENWEYIKFISDEIMYEHEDAAYMFPGTTQPSSPFQIINTGQNYIVRRTTYDNAKPSNSVPDKAKFCIYDLDFNYIRTEVMFEGSYIIKMSYIDDVCYVTLANLKTYKSQDLSTWEEIYDGIGIPLSNSQTTIFTTIEKDQNAIGQLFFQNPIVSKNFKPDKKVAVEGIDMRTTNVCGKFFINYDNRNEEIFQAFDNSTIEKMWESEKNEGKKFPPHVSFSKDGVYWARFTLPEEPKSQISWIEEQKDGILICYGETYAYKLKYSDMEQIVPNSDIYVEVNKEVLGFDTPPILEDDRVLVPMRFLFQKMGAEVEWQEATQTATATLNDEEVSFSIDNNTAKVNGIAESMDVPARMSNDRTMVPLRFLSENLGYDVQWDEETKTAAITTESPQTQISQTGVISNIVNGIKNLFGIRQ